jgi:hypothetical protein
MNLYQNATQMHAIPYNFPTAYGYGFNPNMPLGFPMNAHPYAFNTFSNGFIPNVPNSAAHAATGFNAYPKENLIVSSIAEIEYFSNNNLNNASNKVIKTIKKQNTDRSNQENSKIIKVKTKEIIAIDKKDSNQNFKKSSNKINDSNHLNIKTDENAFDLKNEKNKNSFDLDKKEKESKKEENYGYDSYAQNSSIFTKQLAEDFSIQDEIEYKKPEKKNTQKSFKNVSLKDSNKININNDNNSNYLKKNISIKKTESNLLEEENSQLNLDKFHSKKSLLKQQQTKISKMQNSIDEDIRSDKDITNMSKRIATEKSAKIAAASGPQNNEEFYEDSFKKSFHNSNISENLSYKSYKKSKKDIITNFDDFNNKENSIDDIIDSKSLKDFENEIHSDFKNDQPVIEESKKSLEVKDTSPKNMALQPNRVMTEMKYEKLEVINEESILDKSKSNLKEINNNYNNNVNYKNDFENNENLNIISALKLQQMQNSEIEDDYEENFEISKSRKNPRNHPHNNINSEIDEKVRDYNHNHLLNEKNLNDNEEENIQYAHETFDSLKTHTLKSHKEENEKIEEEENYNNEDKNHKNSEEKIRGKLADVIKTGENYYFEDQNIQEAEHNNISQHSSMSKKNKAASKKSHMLFEELKEKALFMCKEEVFKLKIEEPLEEEGIKENKNSEGEKEEKIINNKSIIKTEEAKPLENSQNQIIEEEQVEDKTEINKKNENQQEAEKIKEENKSEKEEEQEIQLVRKTEEKNAVKTINNNNQEIQEEENLEIKNQEEKLNKSSEQKKEKTEPNEEQINLKNENNANKKTDPDAIEEEKHLEIINQSINKSFKSKKSDKLHENYQKENKAEEKERKEEIEILQANKGEQIIKEEGKDEAKDATKENLISLPNKTETETENNHKEIEIGAALKIQKKRSFSSLKNQIKINFLNNQQEINDFDIIYNAYKAKLNNAQKVTFKPKDSIDDYLRCFNPKIIKISNEANELIGLCCISFDNFWEDSVKININHVSVLDFEFFQNLVGTVLEFIKENIAADEILIELHYEFKDSIFEINTEIRDVFKNAFKFKWHKLENRNGERLQKMGLMVQGADDEKKNQISKFMNSTLEINHFSVMNFINKSELDVNNNVDPTKEEGNNINSDLTHLNYFNLVASLCQIHGGKKSVKSEMLEKYDKVEIKVIFNSIIIILINAF